MGVEAPNSRYKKGQAIDKLGLSFSTYLEDRR